MKFLPSLKRLVTKKVYVVRQFSRRLEQALVAATKKKFYEGTNSEEAQLRVEIDRKTGEYSTFRQWEVVADEDHEMPACQDAISDVDPAQVVNW